MNSFLRRMSWQSRRKGPSTSGEKQTTNSYQEDVDPSPIKAPKTQTVLLLLAAKQPYQLTEKYAVPKLEGEHEVLVRTEAIGLNPIDWKAPVSVIACSPSLALPLTGPNSTGLQLCHSDAAIHLWQRVGRRGSPEPQSYKHSSQIPGQGMGPLPLYRIPATYRAFSSH